MHAFRVQGASPRRRRSAARSFRPRVDALEERALLSSFQLVKDVVPGPTGSGPFSLRSVGGFLMFTARTGPGVYALFQSNGTPAGTTPIKDSGVTSAWRLPSYYDGVVGSRYCFVAEDSSHGDELWVADSTTASTSFINDTNPGTASGGGRLLTADPANGVLYYVADDGNLPRSQVWRTDGTPGGTYKITNIGDPQPPSGFGVIYGAGDGLTVASTGIYFTGGDSNYGYELYVSDGTPGNYRLVKDINPTAKARGATSNGYLPWPELNGRLYFSANDSVTGWELWSTDGTDAGTRRETDINPAGDTEDTSGGPGALIAYKGAVYFSAIDAAHGRELWKFEPGVGPSLVKDINPGAGSSMTIGEPYGTKFTEHRGILYFTADDGTHGEQLWRTDGTEAGTYMVKRIDTPAGAFAPIRGFVSLGNNLYFAANEQGSGFELWQSDGTEAGTHIVEDFAPGPASGIALGDFTDWITVVGGALYFTANNAITGTEVYRLVPETETQTIPFTGRLAPSSDTGASSSDGITRINTPEFIGTGQPGSLVHLYADQTLIGETTINATGSWSLTVTQPLADGTYVISASVSQAASQALDSLRTDAIITVSVPGNLPLGTLVIDTVGPVVTGALLDPVRGLVRLWVQDERSGFFAAALADLANYSVRRFLAPRARDRRVEQVTGVTVTVGGNPTEPVSLVLNLDHNRRITHARFLVLARSRGISDLAGNALRGAFTGRFPTGADTTPQDFQAQLIFDGRRVLPARPLRTTVPLPQPSRVARVGAVR